MSKTTQLSARSLFKQWDKAVVTKLSLSIRAILLQWFVLSLFNLNKHFQFYNDHVTHYVYILWHIFFNIYIFFLTFWKSNLFFSTFWHSNIYIILQKAGKILKISKYSQWVALKRLQKQVGIFFQQTNCVVHVVTIHCIVCKLLLTLRPFYF